MASMFVWWKRKAATDPELRSQDTRTAGMPQQAAGGVEQGYGRKSAEASGLMEGDRPYQGTEWSGADEACVVGERSGRPGELPSFG